MVRSVRQYQGGRVKSGRSRALGLAKRSLSSRREPTQVGQDRACYIAKSRSAADEARASPCSIIASTARKPSDANANGPGRVSAAAFGSPPGPSEFCSPVRIDCESSAMAHHDYYSAAAQVIPILFFVVFIETHEFRVSVHRRRWATRAEAFGACTAVVFFVAGEAAALRGLDHPLGKAGRELVTLSLVYLLILIAYLGLEAVLQPVYDASRKARLEPKPDPDHPREFRGNWARPD